MTKTGSNIKKIRTTKGLSQQAFGELFDLTRGNISSYEENRAEPRIETVVKIANYFSIPLDHFITRNLTVNEILKFNGDKLIAAENDLHTLHLKKVPFISAHIYSKYTQGQQSYNDWDSFPELTLPETANNRLLAVAYNNNIPHHALMDQHQAQDVLIYEETTGSNFHLCPGKPGIYIHETEIFMGLFEQKDKKLVLTLNELKSQTFQVKESGRFWNLFAVYKH
jgi:transcriptional regulator with XRE-family HTH domain